VSLSPAGRAQASTLAERLDGLNIDAIYSSPLERCVETAEPTARAKRLKIVKRDEIGEVRYGALEGKSLKALAKSKIWVQLRAWPSDVRFPGGESLRETQTRAVSAIERIRAEHKGQTVAVFSHGDWIRLAMAHHSGVHIDLYRRLHVEPVSVSALQFYEMGVTVRLLNDTGSLGDLAPAKGEPKKAERSKPAAGVKK
jgi:probable phosphoglycerate mutase